MINASTREIGGNQYDVTVDGTTVRFDLDGFSWTHRGATGDEAYTRDEFISSDENPKHAKALMDYLHIES